MYPPIYADKINVAQGSYTPSSVQSQNNNAFEYWERALFQRAAYKIRMNGLPENWTNDIRDFLIFCLYRRGYVAIFNDKERGVSFNPCTLSGYDFYYQRTKAIVTNPAYNKSLELDIHKDCEILKLTPDYMGIWDIVDYYAEKLANLSSGVDMTITNSKFAFFAWAKTRAAAQALKKLFDNIQKGIPFHVADGRLADDPTSKDVPIQTIFRNGIKNDYILPEQLQDVQTLINMFDAEIGIKTIPYQKKERMVTSEADSKEEDCIARCTIWIETLNESAKCVNAMFGTNISFELRETKDELRETKETEVAVDGNGNDDDSLS